MKKFFGFARRKSSSSLKGINPRRFSIGSSASSTTLQIQVVRGGYNVDLGKVDSSFTKLHKAALLNDEEKVKKQIKNFDVNCRDSSGRTPLHLATVNGNLNMIRTLIEAGANINCQDADGKTPLIKSIECNYDDLTQFFLFANADPQLADYQNGNTPLHWALSSGSIRAAQYLLRNTNKLDVNKRNNQSETCLHLAVKLPQLCVIIEELISKGCNLDAKDDREKTPLMIATANDNSAGVNILLKYGAKTCDDLTKNGHEIGTPNLNPLGHSSRPRTSTPINSDDHDSWPDTDEEDSNYEHPKRNRVPKDNESHSSSASSTKPRKESFKRVSSLVDETIVEEYKADTEDTGDDDDHPRLPSDSHGSTDRGSCDRGSGDRTQQLASVVSETVGNLIWNDVSDDDDETDDGITKKSDSETFGRTETIKGNEEIWRGNDTRDDTIDRRQSSGDVINDLVMLLNEEPSHDKNIDFIDQIKSLLNEEPPKPQAMELVPPPPVEDKPTEVRRRSYAEVVAQKPPQQEMMDELKIAISSRAKNYDTPVTSPKRSNGGNGMVKLKDSSPKKMGNNRKLQNINNKKNDQMSQTNGKTSKIPLPSKNGTKQSPSVLNGSPKKEIPLKDNVNVNVNSVNNNKLISNAATTSEESLSSHEETEVILNVNSKELTIKSPKDVQMVTPVSELPNNDHKQQNGAINSDDIQQLMMQLRIDLEKEINAKSMLMAENELMKNQVTQLRKRSQDENYERLEIEKRLILIDGQLQQNRFEIEMKTQEINDLKLKHLHLQNHSEVISNEKNHLEIDNQKLQNQIKLIMSENETLQKDRVKEHEKLMQSSVAQMSDDNDRVKDMITKIDNLMAENGHLREECERYKMASLDSDMLMERQKFEHQKQMMELESQLKRAHFEIEMVSSKTMTQEHEHEKELIEAIRELNRLMVKLDSRIVQNEESQQQKVRTFNEEMFDCARNLLDQMRIELTNFKQMLQNSANDNLGETNGPITKSSANSKDTDSQLSAFESRIGELRSSLERLEDQLQSQELQLIRQSDILSLAPLPLRKSSSTRELFISSAAGNKPKSWFVQTLFRLQSHNNLGTHTGDSMSAFAHQKWRLQKQIHELKSELGLFAESVH